MKSARMMEVFKTHMMTMGMQAPEKTMMTMCDTPMEVQICGMDKIMMISDGHHTVCCEMTKQCMMNYKKKTDTMPMKKWMGQYVTMMRYTPKVEMHSEKNMTMTMQIHSMEPYPTTNTKMMGNPKPMCMDPQMQMPMEMAYKAMAKMMMNSQMHMEQKDMPEDILAGQKTCMQEKKKMMQQPTNQMMNCMQMREMEHEIDMEARKMMEQDKLNENDSDGEVDPEVMKKEMEADMATLEEFERILAEKRMPTMNKKKMESKPQAKVTKKLDMDAENPQTKQAMMSATSQKGKKEMNQMAQMPKKRMTQEGEMTQMAKKTKMAK